MALTVQTARQLMLEKQGIGWHPLRAGKADLFRTVDQLGCVQIDTINVVERAHYLTLWSRLSQYEKEALHDLLYRDRRLFEHWAHAGLHHPPPGLPLLPRGYACAARGDARTVHAASAR